ncbi:MAG: FAD:protein FMN transferase [bacterium]
MITDESREMMGMTITVEIADNVFDPEIFKKAFDYFKYVDEKFSLFKETSEISLINKKQILPNKFSDDMKEVFELSEKTKKETNGFFDIETSEGLNPTGLVKGWAIKKAADILRKEGIKNFYVNAGGDAETSGNNKEGKPWSVGIRNPFNYEKEVVKVVYIKDKGIATSGSYIKGAHIYNPLKKDESLDKILSMTVIGPNVYEADRFATATFAMGENGINFIEKLEGFEGYMINSKGIATMTSGFNKYTNV